MRFLSLSKQGMIIGYIIQLNLFHLNFTCRNIYFCSLYFRKNLKQKNKKISPIRKSSGKNAREFGRGLRENSGQESNS